jgi:hypothetical protein
VESFNLKTVAVLCLAVISSGCVSLNVNHEIHKDGSSDIGINVQSDSQIVRNALKERFKSSLAVENAILEEGDNSFNYRFENVYPQKQEQRFSEVVRPSSEQNSSSSGFDYEKDSGLLYTHFTLRMKSTGIDTSDTNYPSQYSQLGQSLTSSMELNYNVDPFGTIVDTNGQKLSDGRVRFDLTEDKDYYVEFKALSADLFLTKLGSSQSEQPEWDISAWSECRKNGTHTRTVELENDAENYMFKPPTQGQCEYQTQQSAEELTLDTSTLTDYRVRDEEDVTGESVEEAYQRTFEKDGSTLKHTVVKPGTSTQEYIDSQVQELESENYESAIEYISESDTTEAYSKTIGTETVIQGSGSFTYEQQVDTVRKVVLASKHDVVHKFTLEGTKPIGLTISGIDDFDSIASTAVSNTE